MSGMSFPTTGCRIMRVFGNKAVDLRRADPNFEMAEQSVIDGKKRTGIFAGAVGLGFVLGLVGSVCGIFSNAVGRKGRYW